MKEVILYTDGGARGNPGTAGAGVVVTDSSGKVIKRASKPLGTMTNNEAEYHAAILGFETLKKSFGKEVVRDLYVDHRLDSELVCKQLRGEYQVKEEHLWPLWMRIWNLRVTDFKNVSFTHIPREENAEADKLANEAMDEGRQSQGAMF